MLSHSLVRLATVALFGLSALAQTITTTDADGETIIGFITLDPLGIPTTSVVSTVTEDDDEDELTTSSSSTTLTTPTTTSTTSTTATLQTIATTAPDVQQGPVGAPPATTPGLGPTPYTYTTTDANGETIAVVDTFTPTFPSTSTFTPQSTGSVLDYSQWLSIYGGSGAGSGATAGADSAGAAQAGSAQHLGVGYSLVGIAASWLVGLLGGAWLVAL